MYVLISYAMSFAIVFISWIFPSISKIYNETLPSLAFEILLTFLSIGMPFFVLHLIFKKEKITTDLPFGTTHNKEIAKYLVMVFLPVMVLSAIAINYASALFQEILGLEFTSSVSEITLKGGKETLLGVLSMAVVPAIIEETVIRGIVMQPLRKYGDKYAIIASALLFAVMHGNMVQIPYTVIGGLLLGYLAVITGSLWPSIVLHFINNLYSVIVVSVNDNFGENASTIVTVIILIGFAVIGIIGTVKLTKMKYRITEDWLEDIFGNLFEMMDEQELRALPMKEIATAKYPVEMLSHHFGDLMCNAIRKNMEFISTDVKIDMEGYTRQTSAEKVSRIKGAMIYFEPMFCAKDFGVTEISELWLLEDGRFAEITSVSFIKDELVHVHRKFRKIVKRRKDIWFAAQDLFDSLYLMLKWYTESIIKD